MSPALRFGAALLACAACTRADPGERAHDEHGEAAEHAAAPRAAGQPAPHADEEEHEQLPQRVRLDPEVVAAARIQTAPVARTRLAATLDLPGEVTADPDRTATVSALVTGRIESVRFREGQSVTKGELLATIRAPELGSSRAELAATTARAAAARANAERLQALAEKNLAARQEVLTAQAEADALEARARAAAEHLAAIGSTPAPTRSLLSVRAPVSGTVVSRNAVIGQPVTPEHDLATIADLSELWFLGSVFEKNLSRVRIGAPVEVLLNAYPSERFAGSIEFLSKQIDPVARTITARIPLQNRDDVLRLGLFGIARVGTGEAADKAAALVVPRSAVTEIGQKPAVFVRQADGDFDVHEVVLGDSALGQVEVLNGLREGEQVVVSGVFTLKSAVLKSTFGEHEGH